MRMRPIEFALAAWCLWSGSLVVILWSVSAIQWPRPTPVFNAEHASQCRAIEGMARTPYEAREALMLCRWQAPTPAEMEGIIRWRARHGQR